MIEIAGYPVVTQFVDDKAFWNEQKEIMGITEGDIYGLVSEVELEEMSICVGFVVHLNDVLSDTHACQVLAHELGHIFGRLYFRDDSEEFADDFAWDLLLDQGLSTDLIALVADERNY